MNNFLSILILLFCFFFSYSVFGQNKPSEIPSGEIIVEGQVVSKESVYMTDGVPIPGLYTINWFQPDFFYDGSLETTKPIPILTFGGSNENEFVIVNHSFQFHRNYKYIVSLIPCIDCISNDRVETYIPETYVADFQKEKFFIEKSILKNRARTGRYQQRQQSCGREDSTILFLSFGNIEIEVNGDSISGVIDLKTRTNSYSKPIASFLTELKYDTSVFGNNAISNHSIDTTISSETIPTSVNQTYGLYADLCGYLRLSLPANK